MVPLCLIKISNLYYSYIQCRSNLLIEAFSLRICGIKPIASPAFLALQSALETKQPKNTQLFRVYYIPDFYATCAVLQRPSLFNFVYTGVQK